MPGASAQPHRHSSHLLWGSVCQQATLRQDHRGGTYQSSQCGGGHKLKPYVLDSTGSQWSIGMGQGRPVCLALRALGSRLYGCWCQGPTHKRGGSWERRALEHLPTLGVAFPSKSAVSVVDVPESTWNGPCLKSKGRRAVRHNGSCQAGDQFEGYLQCELEGGRELGSVTAREAGTDSCRCCCKV